MADEKQEAYSPGPWQWREVDGWSCHDLVDANGSTVHGDGSAYGEYRADIDVHGPNAHLIAAAPQLYEALKELHDISGDANIPMTSAKAVPMMARFVKARQNADVALSAALGGK